MSSTVTPASYFQQMREAAPDIVFDSFDQPHAERGVHLFDPERAPLEQSEGATRQIADSVRKMTSLAPSCGGRVAMLQANTGQNLSAGGMRELAVWPFPARVASQSVTDRSGM